MSIALSRASTPPPGLACGNVGQNWKEHSCSLLGSSSVFVSCTAASLGGGLLTSTPPIWTIVVAVIAVIAIAFFLLQLFAARNEHTSFSQSADPLPISDTESAESTPAGTPVRSPPRLRSPNPAPLDQPHLASPLLKTDVQTDEALNEIELEVIDAPVTYMLQALASKAQTVYQYLTQDPREHHPFAQGAVFSGLLAIGFEVVPRIYNSQRYACYPIFP